MDPPKIDGWTVLFATIALVGSGAILSDIGASIPHVVSSLPFKAVALFAILYGATKSYTLALQGIFLFVVLMWTLTTVEFIVAPQEYRGKDPYNRLQHIIA